MTNGHTPGETSVAPSTVSASSKDTANEKVIWLFGRRKDYSRDYYQRHYVEKHAPLGVRLTRGRPGYTVNLVETEGGPDAITEQWVTSAENLSAPEQIYDKPEDFAQVRADRMNDRRDLYVVDERILRGMPVDSPLGRPNPAAKVVWFYDDAANAPPPPAGAQRVVDNRVLRYVARDEQNAPRDRRSGAWPARPSRVALIRMAWAADLGQIEGASDGLVVTEYRFLPSPWE